MSDEARYYVKRFSPFRNSTFWVHYALADIANAQYDYELWVADSVLMSEWPFSRSSIHNAYSELVDGGFLSIIEQSAPGRRTRYRFEFPEVPEMRELQMSFKVWTKRKKVVQNLDDVVQKSDPLLLIRTEENKTNTRDEIFDALVDVCGIQVKALTASARGPLNRAVKELRQVDATADTIHQVARAYRKKWPEALISPTALSKFYPTFLESEAVTEQSRRVSGQTCHSCSGTGWEPYSEAANSVVRCCTCGGRGIVELERTK